MTQTAARAGAVVRATDLVVTYPRFQLGPVTLELQPGTLTCLTGPNGAGKTTLIRALLGLLPADGGHVELAGTPAPQRDPVALRQVGYVPDDQDALIEELTAEELWDLHACAHARVHGDVSAMRARAAELAQRLDFTPPDDPIAGYSHGMRKKTQLVAALLHEPALLVVDEPRNGLDPIGIERLERILRDERDSGTALLAASHDLWWAERMADAAWVIDQGDLLASGSHAALLEDGETELAQAFFRILEREDR